MPQFFINSGIDDKVESFFLSEEESRHIKVLRCRKGDRIKIFDRSGSRYEAEILGFSAGLVSAGKIVKLPNPPKPFSLKIFIPFIEKSAFETAIRHCSEAGADFFVPMKTDYSQGNFEIELEKKRGRLEEIILSSVKQCERPDIPAILPAVSFEEALVSGPGVILLSKDGNFGEKALSPAEILVRTGEKISVLAGPEAGFSEREIKLAVSKKVFFMDLGPYVLRTQTAVLSACSVISSLKKA